MREQANPAHCASRLGGSVEPVEMDGQDVPGGPRTPEPSPSHVCGTLALSWGRWGGFYVNLGYCKRLCLGWLAVTYVPVELDDLMEAYAGG